MPDHFPYDIFLSHSAKDKAMVRPLAELLRPDGVKHADFGCSPPCMSAHAFGSDSEQWEAEVSAGHRRAARLSRSILEKEIAEKS